jgi:colicin import membrane protein
MDPFLPAGYFNLDDVSLRSDAPCLLTHEETRRRALDYIDAPRRRREAAQQKREDAKKARMETAETIAKMKADKAKAAADKKEEDAAAIALRKAERARAAADKKRQAEAAREAKLKAAHAKTTGHLADGKKLSVPATKAAVLFESKAQLSVDADV